MSHNGFDFIGYVSMLAWPCCASSQASHAPLSEPKRAARPDVLVQPSHARELPRSDLNKQTNKQTNK